MGPEMKVCILFYSIVAYLFGFAGLAYTILWMGDIAPGAMGGPISDSGLAPWLWNACLLLLFALQHSVMARPAFKQKLLKIIPQAAERSTYVLASGLSMLIMVVFWSPMPGTVWQANNDILSAVIWAVFLFGWSVCFLATFGTGHFDLFGLRQAYTYFKGEEYTAIPFVRRGLYKWVRHPIQTGVLIGVWATPHMQLEHLLLSVGMSIYVFVGLWFEEKDLIAYFGDEYRSYKSEVGGLFPRIAGK